MFKKYVLTGAFAAVCGSVALGAQNPPTTAQQPTEPRATSQQEMTMKYTGCVYREQDVPGRSPNVAERAGVMEDYILADARPATGSTAGATGTSGTTPPSTTPPTTTPPTTTPPTGTTPSAASASAGEKKMFKLEHADDEKLRAMVGKRVEVTGRVDKDDDTTGTTGTKPSPDRSMGPDQVELDEFEVTSIREVAGTCPDKPAAPRK